MTVADFSDQAGCSEATIVRLAKHIGYEGFPELKSDFRKHIAGESENVFENITNEGQP